MGEDLEVRIPLKGRPVPNVTWRRADRNISSDPKYNIHNTESSTVLIIPKVSRDDSGKYHLEIENGVGEPKTITVSVKVLDTPSSCQRLVVKNVSRGKATLSWEPPLIDGGSAITNYIIEKRDSTKKSYSNVTTECSNTTYKIEGLSEEICYFFRVSAENENGVGDPCETVDPVRATETPDYVISNKARDEKEWTKGQSDYSQVGPVTVQEIIIPPEADLIDYPGNEVSVRIGQTVNIELPYKGKPKPVTQWLKDDIPLKESEQVRLRLTENKAALTIRNVRKDNAGKYTLTLDNKISKNSFNIQVITLGPPSSPIGPIKFDEIKAQGIIISWNEPNDDGGGEITCYSVEKRETSQAAWKMVCSSVVRTTFKIPNLIKGTEYQFRVRAENKYGVSEALPSEAVVAQHQYKPPGPPGRPVVYNVTSDGMTIQWEAPGYDGGSPITGYHVEKKDRNSLLWTKVNTTAISGREYRIIGLIEGLEYQFKVFAQNNAGMSPASETSKHTLAISPVDRLTSPEIDIDASFKQTHIVKNGGTVTLHIPFKGKPPPLATWTKADGEIGVMADINTTETSSTLTIESCTRYDAGKYTLSLENNSGRKSITFTVKVLDTPGPPGPLTFKDVTRGALTLMWDAPLNDGGARIQHYVIEKREASRLSWQEVSIKCSRQILRVTNLAIGVPYLFRVMAENQFGLGEAYEMSEAIIATEEPAPPKRLDIIDTSNSTATLAWLKPEHDVFKSLFLVPTFDLFSSCTKD
uniref:Titin n=1 Tax=Paramormyrops kingsleyae TaxID=1676925 RepID=A0A3B3QBP0_9TELE